jgi:hypothetical protein
VPYWFFFLYGYLEGLLANLNQRNNTKGQTQLPVRSKNSTQASPETGRINAVLNAHSVAHSNTGLIGFIRVTMAMLKSIIPIACIVVIAMSPFIPTVDK